MRTDIKTPLTVGASSLFGMALYIMVAMSFPFKLIGALLLIIACLFIYFIWSSGLETLKRNNG